MPGRKIGYSKSLSNARRSAGQGECPSKIRNARRSAGQGGCPSKIRNARRSAGQGECPSKIRNARRSAGQGEYARRIRSMRTCNPLKSASQPKYSRLFVLVFRRCRCDGSDTLRIFDRCVVAKSGNVAIETQSQAGGISFRCERRRNFLRPRLPSRRFGGACRALCAVASYTVLKAPDSWMDAARNVVLCSLAPTPVSP